MMMDDGRGGGACCVAKYGGGGYGEYVDVSKMHRIMLRFRPIAPKPTAAGSSSSSGSDPDVTSKPAIAAAPRRGRKRPRKAAKGTTSSLVKSEERIVLTTLPLFPESPDGCGCSHDNGGGAAV